jgi:transmembrane sensor
MQNIVELPTENSSDEASLWISRIDNGLSVEQEKALREWMAQSPKNHELLLEMAELWDSMDVLGCLSDLFPQPVSRAYARVKTYQAIAASVVFAVLVGVWGAERFQYFSGISGQPSKAIAVVDKVYETAVGEHSTVNFPDGTELVLNTDTLIKVKYTDKHRLFVLDRGEIHINVAHDTLRPLSVLAGKQVIRAVGTAFNVQMFVNQQVELIVTEGRVHVGERIDAAAPVDVLATPKLPKEPLAIAQGAKVILGTPEQSVEKIDPVEIDASLSWRHGNLVFHGESLEEAIAEISRYTSVEFEIIDDRIKKVRVAGLFKAGDVNGLLEALSDNFNISSQRIGKEKVLLSLPSHPQ